MARDSHGEIRPTAIRRKVLRALQRSMSPPRPHKSGNFNLVFSRHDFSTSLSTTDNRQSLCHQFDCHCVSYGKPFEYRSHAETSPSPLWLPPILIIYVQKPQSWVFRVILATSAQLLVPSVPTTVCSRHDSFARKPVCGQTV